MKTYAIVARMILVAGFLLYAPQVLAFYDNGIAISSPRGGEDVARGGILEIQYRITRPIPPGTNIVFRLMRGCAGCFNIDDEEFAHITHRLPAVDSTHNSYDNLYFVRLPLPPDLTLTAPPFQNTPYYILADIEDQTGYTEYDMDYGVDSQRLYFGKSSDFNIVPLTTMWLGEVNGIRVSKPAGGESFIPGGTITIRYEYEKRFHHPPETVRIHLLETTSWGELAPTLIFETENITDIEIRIPEDILERRENEYAINVSARDPSTDEWLYGISAGFSIQQPLPTFKESESAYTGYTSLIDKVSPGKGKVVRKTGLIVLQPGNRNEHYDMDARLPNIPFRWRFYPGNDNVIPARWDIVLLSPRPANQLDGPFSPYHSINPNFYATYHNPQDPNSPGLLITKGVENQHIFYDYTYTWDESDVIESMGGHFKTRVSGLDFSDESQKHFTIGRDFDLIAGPIYTDETNNTLKIDVGLKGMPLPNGPINFLVELMPDLDYAYRYNEFDRRDIDQWWQALDSWQVIRSVANGHLYNRGAEPEIETVDLGTRPLNSPIIQTLAEEKESCGLWYRVTVDSNDRVPEIPANLTNNTNYGRIFLELHDGAIKLTGDDVDGNTISGNNFNLYIHNCGKLRAFGTLRVRQRGCWWDDRPPGSLYGECQNHDYIELFSRTTDITPSAHLKWGNGYIFKSPDYSDYDETVPLLHQEHFEGMIEITFEGDFANWIPEGQNPMLINYVNDRH